MPYMDCLLHSRAGQVTLAEVDSELWCRCRAEKDRGVPGEQGGSQYNKSLSTKAPPAWTPLHSPLCSGHPPSDGLMSSEPPVLDMCATEAAESLLQSEETFSACLARINAIVLKPLLQSEPHEQKGKENLKLLLLLNDCFHTLWDLTEENHRTLKEKFSISPSLCLQDLYILWKGDLFLSVYIQYFVTFANCVVVQGFDQAAKNKSEFWKTHKTALKQFLADFTSETSIPVALHTVLHKPLRDHVQQYALILTRLSEAIGKSPDRELVTSAAKQYAKLQSFISQVLDEACLTKALWKSLGHKLTEWLCVPERRLLEDSKNLPVFASVGRTNRVLLFDDILVLIQGNNCQSFDLKLVWVDGSGSEKPAPEKHTIHIVTPEEAFFLSAKEPCMKAVWQWKLNQAVRQALNGKRDFPLWGEAREGSEPPVHRCFKYVFRAEGRFKNAAYEGEWYWGKPHGKGTLKWPDGRNHVGDFKEGLEHGFGISLVPLISEDRYDCYKCHWCEGKMRGYGICEYGNEMVYKGYFNDNLRQGFGILENPSAEQPFKYTGQWDNDKKNGYGVWDDKDRGERYIGIWQDDHRHGQGIVVTQSGVCYQRKFHVDKMVGSGILLLENDSVYEGNFTRDLTFVGKGKLTFSNGFTLEGTFSNKSGQGLQTQGILNTSSDQQDASITKVQLGLDEFPVEKRWQGIYDQFLGFLHSGCKEEMEESFTGFHIQTSKELRKSQEYLFCQRGPEDVSGKMEDVLEELVQHQELESLQCYLQKAFKSSLHPLGKLLKALTFAFQATYSGIGANKHLLNMAQEEVKYYAKKIWELYQGLLHLALEQKGQPLAETEDGEKSDLNAYRVILPLILPCFYPELFMLYMLYHEKEDDLYCQGIVDLSLFPDIKLLEVLDVQKHLWPLKDLTLTTNQRRSLVKDKCFLSATECLQKLITTVDPREKLEILQKTYEEIETTVSRVVERDYKLPMDDLLPLLMYVVSRARIQHLGAEIHLIRDLMDPTNEGGMYDFLLTALESCYEHIQKDMRLHQRETWHMARDP
ncbi:ALS2 C-terminal-like protein isoform X2 [Trachemys scripta elegans]|uniref:ALS2 C-terminal-like protein isoform X2 n=1 Tax=Trachemys scripta elegans TaxID=31138 RepID=UPI001553439E|nr:ALS2 C-terminal-like protein isoform X2 [Trachemys scripta elegans]